MATPEIYLFTGPEAGEKNDAIQNIRDAARQRNGDLEEFKYYAEDISVADLILKLESTSLFSPALFITLRNAETIKLKSETDLIAEWVKKSTDNPNTLILISDETSVDKKLQNAIPASNCKIFWEMFENKKNQWVQNYFKKNGFSITTDAVEQILDMVENTTDVLKSECSRFFYCFEKNHTITEEDVDKILSHNREENAWTLFDAMYENGKSSKERFENSLEILQKIRISKESSGKALIAGLTYCFRQLRVWHVIHSSKVGPDDSKLKSMGFSKTNQKKYEQAAKVWTSGQVSSILALLANTDHSIFETGMQFEETKLILLIYSIVVKNGLFCAEYEFSI